MVLHLNNALCGASIALVPGRNEVRCTLERLPLSQGMYRINASVDRGEVLDRVEGVASFAVERGDFYATGRAVEGVREIVLVEQRWDRAAPEAPCASD
jgi:hypothetical protein